MVPSPEVDNYATVPEMCAAQVADEVIQALNTPTVDWWWRISSTWMSWGQY